MPSWPSICVHDEDGLINHEDGRPDDNEREQGKGSLSNPVKILHH